MARPLGSKNKGTRAFRALLATLDRAGEVSLKELVLALYVDATSIDPKIRIPARRELLNRAYGLPRQELAVEHEAGESLSDLLTRLALSAERRARVEGLERWRAQRALAVTTTIEDEKELS